MFWRGDISKQRFHLPRAKAGYTCCIYIHAWMTHTRYDVRSSNTRHRYYVDGKQTRSDTVSYQSDCNDFDPPIMRVRVCVHAVALSFQDDASPHLSGYICIQHTRAHRPGWIIKAEVKTTQEHSYTYIHNILTSMTTLSQKLQQKIRRAFISPS